MDDSERAYCRMQLSKMIESKLDLIAELKQDLQHRKGTLGNSLDDQIVIAEMEYRLEKEETALLTLQEQHWESAALWDLPQTPDIQKQVCQVLHSYITSVKEKGSIPALHASEHLALENSILISSQSDRPSIPMVEWAHHSTDLQVGDRLLEVNGHLVIGKEPSDVNRILEASRPICRIVFLRPLSVYQLLKNNGCKETSNLRHELTSVVSRLNHKMMANTQLTDQNSKLQIENDELKMQNRKLKLQVLSLQSVLVCLYQILEKTSYHNNNNDTLHTMLFSQCPSIFDLLRKTTSEQNGTLFCSNILQNILDWKKKSLPWLELSSDIDDCKKSMDATQEDEKDKR